MRSIPLHLGGLATMVLLGAVLIAAACSPQVQGPPRGGEQLDPDLAVREIARLFYAGRYQDALDRTDAFFAAHPVAEDTFHLLLFKGESEYFLGQTDRAIQSFQRTIPFIEKLNNVLQRRYAGVFFRLGTLFRKKGHTDTAIRYVETGLVREPQNMYSQIFLGELFLDRGEPDRALRHFTDLRDGVSPRTEERVVLTLKIDRLQGAAGQPPAPRIEMADQPFYSGLSLGILPFDEPDPAVSLRDVCLLLESKWLIRCEVMPRLTLDEVSLLNGERNQYDGNRILTELKTRYPIDTRPHRFIIAVTGRDIFGTGTNFVFSWQNPHAGVGVVSTHRFLAGLDEVYERPIIATRRLGIQFLSTSGSVLGFARPTKPDCPMAYPHDLGEFLLKGSKLCESTIQQRDALLKATGGPATRVGVQRNEEINRAYRTYHFD